MDTKRFAALLGAAAATITSIVTFAAPASAGPVQIQAGCRFELLRVTANELQEDPHDEIYLSIGDNLTNTVGFDEGQSRPGGDFGGFAEITEFIPAGGRIAVQMFEWDWGQDEKIDGFFASCTPGYDTEELVGIGANYDLYYRVLALP